MAMHTALGINTFRAARVFRYFKVQLGIPMMIMGINMTSNSKYLCSIDIYIFFFHKLQRNKTSRISQKSYTHKELEINVHEAEMSTQLAYLLSLIFVNSRCNPSREISR